MFPDRAPQLPVSTALKIMLLAAVLLAAGCKKQENSSRGTLAVTDFRGRELRFEKPVERAVCLIVSALSGIFMLRANDRLVAIPGSIYAVMQFLYGSEKAGTR